MSVLDGLNQVMPALGFVSAAGLGRDGPHVSHTRLPPSAWLCGRSGTTMRRDRPGPADV